MQSRCSLATAILPFVLFAGSLSAAQFGVTVSVPNHNGDALALLFQLTNANPAANQAVLNNFTFSSASVDGAPVFQGDASGSVAGGITMGDTSNPNTARINFTPSGVASVTFNLDISENFTAPGPGDFFGFNILLNGNPLGSTDPGGTNLFLSGPIGQNGIAFTTFTDGRGMTVTLSDPFPETGNVPEPATTALLGLGLAALATWRKVANKRKSTPVIS